MEKIASPNELQAELKSVMDYVHQEEKPDRDVVASMLYDLAERVSPEPLDKIASEDGRKMLQEKVKSAKKALDQLRKLDPADFSIGSFYEKEFPKLKQISNTAKKRHADLRSTVAKFVSMAEKTMQSK